MGINPDFVGRSFPSGPGYRVGRESVRQFAAAVGATDPVHYDVEVARAAGFADVIATPTYAVVVSQQAAQEAYRDPSAGIDFSRALHGEQRFVHHSPLVAGADVVPTLHIEDVRQVGRNSIMTTRVELATPQGEPLCTAYSTLVIRG